MSMRRTREGLSVRGTGLKPRLEPLQEGLPGKRHPAKLNDTADTWIGACFFAKNIMKFLRGLLCLFFEKTGSRDFKKSIIVKFNGLAGVFSIPRTCMVDSAP